MALGIPASCLGLIVAGDVGGYTLYTDRWGRKVAFPQSPPKEPPSPMQVKQRNRFASSVANWVAETREVKNTWEQLSLAANVCMTGHNLYIHYSLSNDQPALDTLIAQTGIFVTMPSSVPWP